ncbi:MAG TPA: cytochrome P450 [Pseudonocardia sp.]
MNPIDQFDHYDVPIGHDHTPFGAYEAIRDWGVREDRQLAWSQKYGGFWVVFGYQAANDIFSDHPRFSNKYSTYPVYTSPGARPLMLGAYDEPAHRKYRRLVQGPFSGRAATLLTETLRATANDLIDNFISDGRVEIVSALANELPSRMMAIILGLPPEDGDRYREWTEAMARQALTDPEGAGKVLAGMDVWFRELLAERRRCPGDDVFSGILDAEVDGERLTEEELYDFVVVLLLGGIDTTVKLLSTMFWRLAWDVELRRRLIDRPDLIVPAADEFLRYYPPATFVRVVKEPLTLHGVEMEPEQVVVGIMPAINRDPRQFPNPDAFLPDRNPNRHLTLGLGIHKCLGTHLVRLETRVAIEELLRRIPRFELAPGSAPVWQNGTISGMDSVELLFEPGVREHQGASRLALA